MAQPHCDECGERFNSQYNLELHQKLDACSGDDDSQPPEREQERTAQRTEVVTGATGTVCMFDEDRGFGFVTTTDATRELADGTETTEDVFFHITDTGTEWVEEGDRLEFTIVENSEGLRCEDVEVVERDRNRDSYDEPDDRTSSRVGFGHQKDDTKRRPGRSSTTNRDIEGFQDERKFR